MKKNIFSKFRHLKKSFFVSVKSRSVIPLYKKHKKEARELVLRRLEYFNKFYGFSWNRVAIRNQKTRWGSCSKKKNLNFHFRLALIPEDLADYVVVHELCHLKEFNHSKDFWSLVEQAVPDYQSRRNTLRSHKI
jgi:predicted metal-dependent hydrolase